MDDEFYMREALKEAEISLQDGDWPIGAVVVLDGEIIARGRNHVYSTDDHLSHAEINALRKVQSVLYKNKNKATLYATYEPCPMCFGAAILSRIKRVVYGVEIHDSGATHLLHSLPNLYKIDEFKMTVDSGVLAKECYELFMKGKPLKKIVDENLINEQKIKDLS